MARIGRSYPVSAYVHISKRATAAAQQNAAADDASVTATAYNPTVAAATNAAAGNASGAFTAGNATISSTGSQNAPAGNATANVVAYAATVTAASSPAAGNASVTATANNTTVTRASTPPAGNATVTATAYQPSRSIQTKAGNATVTATAYNATVSTTSAPIAVIGVVSDVHTSSSTMYLQDQVRDAMMAESPDFILMPGDCTYDGITADFATDFDGVWGAEKSIIYPAPGNHDQPWNSSGAAPYETYFGSAKVGSGGSGHFYSFDYAGWHFISLDLAEGTMDAQVGSAQYTWLDADLTANSTKPTILWWHEPRYSADTYYGDLTSEGQDDVWALLMTYPQVEAIFNGHAHTFQRWKRMDNTKTADSVDGIRQFIVATGGYGWKGSETSHANKEYWYGVGNPITGGDGTHNGPFGFTKLTLGTNWYKVEFIRSTDSAVLDTITQSTRTTAVNGTNASAGNASASFTANSPTTTRTGTPTPGNSSVSVTANSPTVTRASTPPAGGGTLTATAYNPTVTRTGTPGAGVSSVTATAYGTTSKVNSPAGNASVSATGSQPSAQVAPPATAATVTATAYNTTTATASNAPAGVSTVTAGANNASVNVTGGSNPQAGNGSVTVVANPATVKVAPQPTGPSAVVAALQASVQVLHAAPAGNATAAATAYPATVKVATGPTFGAVSATANQATAGASGATNAQAGVATAGFTAFNALCTRTANALAGNASVGVTAYNLRGAINTKAGAATGAMLAFTVLMQTVDQSIKPIKVYNSNKPIWTYKEDSVAVVVRDDPEIVVRED